MEGRAIEGGTFVSECVKTRTFTRKENPATYSCHNRDPVPVKFKHVTNIETCTLLCCDHITL